MLQASTEDELSMADDHYMPFFVGDFLASTATWTGPERGLYIQMLALEWSSGPLPADPDRLARVLGYSNSEFEPIWPQVSGKFHRKDGKLTNARLEVHRKRTADLAAKRHEKALHAATVRHAGSSAASNAPSMPEVSSEHDSGIAPSMPSSLVQSIPIQTTPSKPKKSMAAAPPWWEEFRREYPKRAGDQKWRDALRASNQRLAEGHSVKQFLDGARRYAAFIRATGKERTEYVKQAATFLGPGKPFMERFELPAQAETAMDEIRRLNGKGPNHDERTVDAEQPSASGVDTSSRLVRS
jgi:uncharacterized protein YdaU (DUF1376 family)